MTTMQYILTKKKTKIAESNERRHYNPSIETRTKCDASWQGLDAALEQLDHEGWKTVAFTSRFQTLSKREEA